MRRVGQEVSVREATEDSEQVGPLTGFPFWRGLSCCSKDNEGGGGGVWVGSADDMEHLDLLWS